MELYEIKENKLEYRMCFKQKIISKSDQQIINNNFYTIYKMFLFRVP